MQHAVPCRALPSTGLSASVLRRRSTASCGCEPMAQVLALGVRFSFKLALMVCLNNDSEWCHSLYARAAHGSVPYRWRAMRLPGSSMGRILPPWEISAIFCDIAGFNALKKQRCPRYSRQGREKSSPIGGERRHKNPPHTIDNSTTNQVLCFAAVFFSFFILAGRILVDRCSLGNRLRALTWRGI